MKRNILLIILMFGFIAGYTGTAAANNLYVNVSAPVSVSPNSDVNINIILDSQNDTRGFSMLVNIPQTWNVSQWSVSGLDNPDNVSYQQAPDNLWYDGHIAYSWTFEISPAYYENNPIHENISAALNLVLKASEQQGDYQIIYDWFTTEPNDFGNSTIDVKVIESGGSDGSGSSSGGGSGSTGEAFENIALKEVIRKYITSGTTVVYEFKEDANSIEFVKFDAKTNAGYITAIIEVLRDSSALVSTAPSGEVYQQMNIWIGNSGYATENNIANPVIGFKVARSWIAENNIDESTIRLNRYSDGNWNPLTTSLIDKDTIHLQFESVTSGFSAFVITAEKKEAEAVGERIVSEPTAGMEEPEPTSVQTPEQTSFEEKSGIPGFGLLVSLSVMLMAAQLLRKKR